MDRIPLVKAAKIAGMPAQSLREHMKRKVIDIGFVSKSNGRYSYVVYRSKLEKLIGRELTDEELK